MKRRWCPADGMLCLWPSSTATGPAAYGHRRLKASARPPAECGQWRLTWSMVSGKRRNGAGDIPTARSGRGRRRDEGAAFLGGEVEALALAVVELHRAEQNA